MIVRIHREFTINAFHEKFFWFRTRVLFSAPLRPIIFYWSIMTAVDSIKCRCAHSSMTGQVGGFQNPGVCLQAFPSFLPHPSSLSYLRHFSRGLWLSFLVLCFYTAQKRLLRRLNPPRFSFFITRSMDFEEKIEGLWLCIQATKVGGCKN